MTAMEILHLVARRLLGAVLAAVLALTPALARGESSGPVVTPPSRSAAPSPEQEYNRGLRARASRDWPAAVGAFRKAVELRPAFPEAWNELGYALRNQGRYDESVRAYDEALRLRPRYPEALEYLGEAYVKMGRLDDARRVLDRLKPLDGERARELAEEIQKGK
jgi:Flp pilus assembly protein TadD